MAEEEKENAAENDERQDAHGEEGDQRVLQFFAMVTKHG